MVELDRVSVDEAIKLELESDETDCVGGDIIEGGEVLELDVDAVAVESLELVDSELAPILVEL